MELTSSTDDEQVDFVKTTLEKLLVDCKTKYPQT